VLELKVEYGGMLLQMLPVAQRITGVLVLSFLKEQPYCPIGTALVAACVEDESCARAAFGISARKNNGRIAKSNSKIFLTILS
jgi:hypothetical protein